MVDGIVLSATTDPKGDFSLNYHAIYLEKRNFFFHRESVSQSFLISCHMWLVVFAKIFVMMMMMMTGPRVGHTIFEESRRAFMKFLKRKLSNFEDKNHGGICFIHNRSLLRFFHLHIDGATV